MCFFQLIFQLERYFDTKKFNTEKIATISKRLAELELNERF